MMDNNENVLTEFESIKKLDKPIHWFSIGFSLTISILFFVMGYKYYQMWKNYHNPERIADFCTLFSCASFVLSTALHQIVIRYMFIRKSDLIEELNKGK